MSLLSLLIIIKDHLQMLEKFSDNKEWSFDELRHSRINNHENSFLQMSVYILDLVRLIIQAEIINFQLDFNIDDEVKKQKSIHIIICVRDCQLDFWDLIRFDDALSSHERHLWAVCVWYRRWKIWQIKLTNLISDKCSIQILNHLHEILNCLIQCIELISCLLS